MRLTFTKLFNWLFIEPYTFNWVAGAIAGVGALNYLGSQKTAGELSDASTAASDRLYAGIEDANNQLYSSYDRARGYLDPYEQSGKTAYQQYLLNQGGTPVETDQVLKWGDLDYNQRTEWLKANEGEERPSVNQRVTVPSGLIGAGQTANLAPEWADYLDPDNTDPGAFNFAEGGFSFDDSSVKLDEGWKWRQAEGQKSLDRKLSSLGLGRSGLAAKEGMRYNQGFLSNEYGKAHARQYGQALDEYSSRYGVARDEYGSEVDTYNRGYGENMDAYNMDYGSWQDMMTRLGGTASQGMAASGSLADMSMAFGAGYGNNIMTGAGAQASNLMNQGNIGANLAQSRWSTLTDVAGLGVQAYTGSQMNKSGNTTNNWWGSGGSDYADDWVSDDPSAWG